MPHVLLKLPEVCRRTCLTRTPVYARVKDGTFPAPVKTGERAVAWLESEVDEWIERQLSTRGGK